MKSYFSTLFLILFSLPALSQNTNISFKIDKFEGKYALIAYHFGAKQYILDTIPRQENGRFVMKYDSLLPGGIYLFVLPPKNSYFEFLVDSADGQHFSLETDTSDFVGNMKVTGSRENEIFFDDIRFIAEKRKQDEKLDALPQTPENQQALKNLDKEVITKRLKIIADYPQLLYAKMLLATKEPEIPEEPKDTIPAQFKDSSSPSYFAYSYYKKHYWDNFDFTDARLLRTPILEEKLNQYLDKVCSQNSDSLSKEVLLLIQKAENGGSFEVFKYMVVTLLNKYANSRRKGDDAVYVTVAEHYYCTGKALAWTDSIQVKRICDRAVPPREDGCWGRAFPNCSFIDSNKNKMSIYDFRADYFIVFIWNEEDKNNAKYLQQLSSIVKYYGENNLKMFTLSSRLSYENWKQKLLLSPRLSHISPKNIPSKRDWSKHFWEETDIPYSQPFIHLLDTTQCTYNKIDLLGQKSRIFVLDKDKKIIAKYVSPKLCDEIINHYINNKDEPSVIFEEEVEIEE